MISAQLTAAPVFAQSTEGAAGQGAAGGSSGAAAPGSAGGAAGGGAAVSYTHLTLPTR